MAFLSEESDLPEGSLLYSMSAALLVRTTGSSLAIPSSNQTGFFLSLAKGIHGRVVDGITDKAPSSFSIIFGTVLQSLLGGVGEALTQIKH